MHNYSLVTQSGTNFRGIVSKAERRLLMPGKPCQTRPAAQQWRDPVSFSWR
jgi:hypothetical protein